MITGPDLQDDTDDGEILAEVRRIKRKLSDQYGGDIHRMFEALRAREATSDRPRITRLRKNTSNPTVFQTVTNTKPAGLR